MLSNINGIIKNILCGRKRPREEKIVKKEIIDKIKDITLDEDDLLSSMRDDFLNTDNSYCSYEYFNLNKPIQIDLTQDYDDNTATFIQEYIKLEPKQYLTKEEYNIFMNINEYSKKSKDEINYPPIDIEQFSIFLKYIFNILNIIYSILQYPNENELLNDNLSAKSLRSIDFTNMLNEEVYLIL
jgi:hypothetical protein